MTQPVLGIESRSFSLSSSNKPFKVYGDDLDMWTLLEAKLESSACDWPKPTVMGQNKNFIRLRANPTAKPIPPGPAPAAAPAAAAAPATAGDGDLTVTLTFEDDDGNPVELVLICEDITYTP